MSLVATIQNAVDVAFEAVGDLAFNAILVRSARGNYDALTGAIAKTDLTADYQAVVEQFLDKPQDSADNVKRKSLKILLKPGPDLTPQTGDYIRIDNRSYLIEDVDALKPDGSTVLLYTCTVVL